MVEVNRMTTPANMRWKLVDRETGAENAQIDWTFRVGDQVKIRLVNEMDSDHPMPHPFHVHGAGRFLILARDDVVEPNLVWKDTVLVRTGETVDILLDVTNPGRWMAHCHIAEHHESGMMFSFNVEPSGVSVAAVAQPSARRAASQPSSWGLVVGVAQAATPLAFWWLDAATVYALGLALIASIYIGFAVADGRWIVIAVETGVASDVRHHRRRGDHGHTVAAGRRPRRARVQGPLAAPEPLRRQHTLVAAVLPRRRLGRRRNHRRRDRGGCSVPRLTRRWHV